MRRVKRARVVRTSHAKCGREDDFDFDGLDREHKRRIDAAAKRKGGPVKGDDDYIVIRSVGGLFWTGEDWTEHLSGALRLSPVDPWLQVSRAMAKYAKKQTGVDCLIMYIAGR